MLPPMPNQKITICGSMSFITQIQQLKNDLEKKGYKVFIPNAEGTSVDYSKLTKDEQIDLRKEFIDVHITKIKNSDAVLIANYTKHDIENYIGANSFLEMGFAYLLKKKIFILNNIPNQPNTVEIEGLKPIVLSGKMELINLN